MYLTSLKANTEAGYLGTLVEDEGNEVCRWQLGRSTTSATYRYVYMLLIIVEKREEESCIGHNARGVGRNPHQQLLLGMLGLTTSIVIVLGWIAPPIGRALVKGSGTPHGIGVLENIGGVKTRTGLTSEVKDVITQGVVVRPIIAHIHILRVLPHTYGFVSFVFNSLLIPLVQESARCNSNRCLEIGRCPRWPCLWLTILCLYEKGCVFNHLVTGLRVTSRIPVFVSAPWSWTVFCRPSPVPSASELTFWPLILAFWATLVLWAASGDPLAVGGLVINCHHFHNQGCQDMNLRTLSCRSPSCSFLSHWTRSRLYSFLKLVTSFGLNADIICWMYGPFLTADVISGHCTSCTVADVIINGHTDLLYGFLTLTSLLYSLQIAVALVRISSCFPCLSLTGFARLARPKSTANKWIQMERPFGADVKVLLYLKYGELSSAYCILMKNVADKDYNKESPAITTRQSFLDSSILPQQSLCLLKHKGAVAVFSASFSAIAPEEYAKRNYANNISEYNTVLGSLTAQRRHFLLRDVYDDMLLDGVQPIRDTFHNLIVGAMKGARLQDALYFLDEMKYMGLIPDNGHSVRVTCNLKTVPSGSIVDKPAVGVDSTIIVGMGIALVGANTEADVAATAEIARASIGIATVRNGAPIVDGGIGTVLNVDTVPHGLARGVREDDEINAPHGSGVCFTRTAGGITVSGMKEIGIEGLAEIKISLVLIPIAVALGTPFNLIFTILAA
eukprot:Gb_40112 [translate_table: standard]